MKIVAIDLGKRKSVAGVYETDGDQIRYLTVSSTPQSFHDLVVETAPDRVVIEIGPQAGWVHDVVTALDVEIEVANPSHEAWRWRSVRTKTDRQDALKLPRLSAAGQLPTVYMPRREVRDWRGLIKYRQSLVARRTAIKNSIRAMLTRMCLPMPSGASGWTRDSVARLHELAMIDDGQLWRTALAEDLQQLALVQQSIVRIEGELERIGRADDRVQLLKTIPGVGARLAETIVAVIDDPHRFDRGRRVGSYAGLTPRQFQSGNVNRQGRITSEGHRVLRSLLVQVAWLGLRHNRWMREVYERVRRGSEANKKIAIIAVARRLLIRCWAMLRDNTRWREPSRAALQLAA
jgi:transposase